MLPTVMFLDIGYLTAMLTLKIAIEKVFHRVELSVAVYCGSVSEEISGLDMVQRTENAERNEL